MKSYLKKCEIDKKKFFDLYENAKEGKVDLLSVSTEILEKMCILLEEEIKIKEEYIEKLYKEDE